MRPRLARGAALLALLGASFTLTAAAQPQQETPALQRQWAIAAGRAVKIDVRTNGWYRVSRSRLRRAGADFSSQGKLRLYADGREVPVRITKGALEFYGLARDTASTDTRTYWLVSASPGGLRIPVVAATTARSKGFARTFPFTLEQKYRTTYTSLQNGEQQNFFGPQIYAAPTTLPLRVRDLGGRRGTFEVVAQGFSKKAHRMKVVLNNVELGTLAFTGQTLASKRFPLPAGVLRATNSLTLTSVGGELDVSFLDTVRVTYPRRYTADRNALRFSLPAGAAGRVTGFSHPNVTVVDVTRPAAPRVLLPSVRRSGGAFAALIAPAPHLRRLIALTAPAKPVALVRNSPSNWHGAGGADVVLITHGGFRPQLAKLKAFREQQGFKVALVDVADLYDEFTFGAHDPRAIKAFLAHARTDWKPAPRYVVLGGDATSDPRNHLGEGRRDFVPTKTIDTQYMETASDDWFADFNEDGVPEMAVGRLPVRTSAEAATVVDKIIGYEQASVAPRPETLLVSDTGFEPATNSLRQLLPTSTTPVTVNRRDGPSDAAVRGRILNELNGGPSVVNYYGHGTIDLWTGAGLLKSGDAASLQNAGRLSLFVMMTCLNGYFIQPNLQSLAESLLRASGGGAVAVWASSGLTEAGDQVRANEELFRQLANGDSPRLGDAMVRAKAAISDLDVRRTWILFGDPLTRLR